MAPTRSPGYPSIPLGEAIELIKRLHASNRTNPIDREAAVKEMGYTSLSGRSAKVLSDLSHFGLLEKTGSGSVRVARRAVEILYPESDESRLAALHAAADCPALFGELNSHFADGAPSENALRSYLMRNGFASAAIPPVMKSYIETYRTLEQQNITASHGASEENREESNRSTAVTVIRQADATATGRATVVGHAGVSLMSGERIAFTEESQPGHYLKLVANGPLDDSMLEALEDFVKRQRKRLVSIQSLARNAYGSEPEREA